MAEPKEPPADGLGERIPDVVGDDAGPEQPEHDPTGLELARRIARQVRAGGASEPARRRRRRRTDPQSSSARPDDRDPQLIGDAVERVFDHLGWNHEVNVHMLLGRWAEFVGAEVAGHARPERFDDAVLTVRTDSTSWATELRLLAPQIVALLNQQLGHGMVERIEVKGPDAPSWSHGQRRVHGGRGPRDTYG